MSVPENNPSRLKPPPNSLKLTGSATGNPRNKCILKPGHSLMDWIRLEKSGCDLSGTNGNVIAVSSKELSKHCTKDDAWMAIRGNVYNVTRYMNFHPGGPADLMRGVGKDASRLFDEVHAWVNYDQLLKKCLIGPLQHVKINTFCFKPLKTDLLPHQPVFSADKIPTKVIPRIDWIQKLSYLTLYFYTKRHCNPGLILQRKNDKSIKVSTCIGNCWYQHNFELYEEIIWPPIIIKISSESGKIEISFRKTKTDLWPKYGTYELTDQHLEENYEFEIIQKRNFNHNSFALVLRGKNNTIMLPPVGYHLTFSCYIEEKEVIRSYTPVPNKYSPVNSDSIMDLHFLLKTYEKGLLSNYIKNLQDKSSIIIIVSPPKGNLFLHKFVGHTRIALLAAGSGITPMLRIIDYLLAKNSTQIENLILLFFNKTENDIWCKTILEEIMKTDERLKITHLLSEPPEENNRLNEHICKELLTKIKNPSTEMYSTFICVCGPPVFNRLTETILNCLHFSPTNVHFFKS